LNIVLANGVAVVEDWWIPREHKCYYVAETNTVYVHPSYWMMIKHNRTPYWTHHMRGVHEADRDRRKYANP
jgi:hypothetical protein